LQIIIMHSRFKHARTIKVERRWVALAAAGVVAVIVAMSGLLSYLTLNNAVANKLPLVRGWIADQAAEGLKDRDDFVRANISALAVKLGEIQAQVSRLDVLGDRVASMAGVRPQELPTKDPGRGGPLSPNARELSLTELAMAVERTSRLLELRADQLNIAESELLAKSVRGKLMPSEQPLSDGAMGSRFGSRIDPFNGRSAMHEGIDFNAPTGTPILAAAGGVVVFAEYHPGYGNQVDVDHGNDLITRYAHASKLLVKAGDIVKRGQKIAEVGSTGRSTGPHLHFEVRIAGVAQDPAGYLRGDFDLKDSKLAQAKP
jgi:murein DD-endopeptidase MepM/ murein hydrolase activator NlpD